MIKKTFEKKVDFFNTLFTCFLENVPCAYDKGKLTIDFYNNADIRKIEASEYKVEISKK